MGGRSEVRFSAHTVIPAQAGTSGQEATAGLAEVPAFAGTT